MNPKSRMDVEFVLYIVFMFMLLIIFLIGTEIIRSTKGIDQAKITADKLKKAYLKAIIPIPTYIFYKIFIE